MNFCNNINNLKIRYNIFGCYCSVNINSDNKIIKVFRIHRLVSLTFIDNSNKEKYNIDENIKKLKILNGVIKKIQHI